MALMIIMGIFKTRFVSSLHCTEEETRTGVLSHGLLVHLNYYEENMKETGKNTKTAFFVGLS